MNLSLKKSKGRETAEDRQELEQLDVEGGDGWGGDGSAALAVVVAANDDDFVEYDVMEPATTPTNGFSLV